MVSILKCALLFRQLISVSTIENIVQQLTTDLHRKTTRSLDSLLGVKAAEAEKEELMNLCEELPIEEVGLTIQEKTLKLFKLTSDDVILAKQKLEKTDLMTKSLFNIREEAKYNGNYLLASQCDQHFV